MTVLSSENKRSYTGNGLTKVFSFPYLFYASDDLRVYLDGVRQTSGYTVLGEGTNLGTVTFLTAPAVDVVVYIDRYVSFTQDTDFENFDGNPSDVTEKQFDLLVMQTQQLNEADSRTLIVPVGDSATNIQLPSVTNRASKFLAFDSAGNPIAAAAATSEGTAFGATGLLLAAASTPADAIATLALFTSAQSVTSTWNFNGTLNVNAKLVTPDKSELTISSGAVQPNGVFHTLDTQGDAPTDDWDTILSPTNGQWNIFRTANSARAVVVKHGTGNISIANNLDINLTSTNRAILTIYDLELNKNLVIADGTTKEYVDNEDTKLKAQFLHIQDQKAANTQGGTATSGSFQTRTLNTVLTNTITDASLATNQITLPAGTYWIEAECPAYTVSTHKAILYNVTGAENTLIGSSVTASSSYFGYTQAFVKGRFTIAGNTVFEIRHRVNETRTTNGFGVASNFGVNEVYTDVRIWKVA
jgi:hypothetical protein